MADDKSDTERTLSETLSSHLSHRTRGMWSYLLEVGQVPNPYSHRKNPPNKKRLDPN